MNTGTVKFNFGSHKCILGFGMLFGFLTNDFWRRFKWVLSQDYTIQILKINSIFIKYHRTYAWSFALYKS